MICHVPDVEFEISIYSGPTSIPSIERWTTPPFGEPSSSKGKPCSSRSVPLNITCSPATAEPEISDTSITVGARIIILVQV